MAAFLTRRVVPAPAAAAALAVALAAVVVVASLRPAGWNVTSLPRVGTNTPLGALAKRRDPDFHTVAYGGYDGQFYWAVAIDPLATGSAHRAVDRPEYRYGHPLLGWLGWAASGGQADAAAAALLAVGLVSLAAAAAAAAVLARRLRRRATSALFVACSPGLLYSAAHALAEPLAVALLLGGLAAHAARRRSVVLVCLALAPLAREQLVLAPLALAAWELLPRCANRRAAVAYAATLVPSALWWVYLRVHLGGWFTSGSSALDVPLKGWRRALLDAGTHASAGGDEATLIVLVALLGVLTLAGLAALRGRSPADLVYLALGLLALCLAANATVILRDALRNTAILLALVPFVLDRARSEQPLTASPPPPPTSPAHPDAGSSTEPPPSPT